MKRFLADTHIILWGLEDSSILSEDVKELLKNPVHDVVVSAVTAWEIALKRSLGKLEAPQDFERVIEECGFHALPITFEHALTTEHLPFHHRDPFDRLLVAQAKVEHLTLLTRDRRLQQYDIDVLCV